MVGFTGRVIVPPSAKIGTKSGGLGAWPSRKETKRVVIYLTESEHLGVTWAAERARRRASDAVRLLAVDWANSQIDKAEREGGQG